MTTIESGTGVVTQINVFRVDPARVDELLAVLQEAARAVQAVPGWLSANLHVALDRTQVVNYAQCATQEAWDQVMNVLFARGFIDRLTALARPEPCLYRVAWTLDARAKATPRTELD